MAADERIGHVWFINPLEGLRHEDFALLGQFCAKSIPYAFSHPKCSSETKRKISNEFYQGELTVIIILVIFEDMASKLENIAQFFQVSTCHP